ncbi:hypothetical protein A5699_21175 [Mycobacterium sp. E802]|uniref:hypothetical protein n=1 Tax=Mycobacterium sp. E802 TaxID=1834152 RepID=UPI000800CBB1|nr:hypothetical protein [Mycobacterium sp. E802]OBG86706.1 hypothetical protein A5699_21175 [Mycobacterium sp. E802]
MVRSSFAGDGQLWWIIAGAAAGAVAHHLLSAIWPSPAALLLVTLIVAAICGTVIGLMLTWRVRAEVRGFVMGMAGATTSLSGYTALAMDQPASATIAYLVLAPGCVCAGLFAGARVGLALPGTAREDGDS